MTHKSSYSLPFIVLGIVAATLVAEGYFGAVYETAPVDDEMPSNARCVVIPVDDEMPSNARCVVMGTDYEQSETQTGSLFNLESYLPLLITIAGAGPAKSAITKAIAIRRSMPPDLRRIIRDEIGAAAADGADGAREGEKASDSHT